MEDLFELCCGFVFYRFLIMKRVGRRKTFGCGRKLEGFATRGKLLGGVVGENLAR